MRIVRNLLLMSAAVATLMIATPAVADAGLLHGPASCCAPEPCCVPPPPVEVTLCIQNPFTCCPEEVSVCVPACCAHEAPCLVSCRRGFLGRQILTYKWPCCGHCVDIVVTKHFGVIVRD